MNGDSEGDGEDALAFRRNRGRSGRRLSPAIRADLEQITAPARQRPYIPRSVDRSRDTQAPVIEVSSDPPVREVVNLVSDDGPSAPIELSSDSHQGDSPILLEDRNGFDHPENDIISWNSPPPIQSTSPGTDQHENLHAQNVWSGPVHDQASWKSPVHDRPTRPQDYQPENMLSSPGSSSLSDISTDSRVGQQIATPLPSSYRLRSRRETQLKPFSSYAKKERALFGTRVVAIGDKTEEIPIDSDGSSDEQETEQSNLHSEPHSSFESDEDMEDEATDLSSEVSDLSELNTFHYARPEDRRGEDDDDTDDPTILGNDEEELWLARSNPVEEWIERDVLDYLNNQQDSGVEGKESSEDGAYGSKTSFTHGQSPAIWDRPIASSSKGPMIPWPEQQATSEGPDLHGEDPDEHLPLHLAHTPSPWPTNLSGSNDPRDKLRRAKALRTSPAALSKACEDQPPILLMSLSENRLSVECVDCPIFANIVRVIPKVVADKQNTNTYASYALQLLKMFGTGQMYCGEALVGGKRMLQHCQELSRPVNHQCLFYYIATRQNRKTTFVSMGIDDRIITALCSSYPVNVIDGLAKLIEHYLQCLFQLLPAKMLRMWLPNEVPLRPEIGLNVQPPIGPLGAPSAVFHTQASTDPEVRSYYDDKTKAKEHKRPAPQASHSRMYFWNGELCRRADFTTIGLSTEETKDMNIRLEKQSELKGSSEARTKANANRKERDKRRNLLGLSSKNFTKRLGWDATLGKHYILPDDA
ncbi:hypothetical protein M409DRAFT_51672 [Zasmidium cellare ATCC 36951]|uniref:Uncharacterized protein n=1 Tax=Zasmidium cellare ATCC 36951 TaxID=1080233 RepID=A0A6A6CXY4_ZASCE|nr:uncharacterized protein M409DRAFT_51672 [Zasmidium cellare ATCC 36951]KAF2170669.1 hypothetical protein M409DRAFT_51672 [Zasmidium cellare ATCC 36951]